MKNKIISIFAILFSWAASSSHAAELNLDIGPLKSKTGSVLVTVYANSDGFPKDPSKALRSYRIEANTSQSNRVSLAIENLTAGKYAIALIHDENNDNVLETGLFGIPVEGYGFSKNAKGIFGPPKFESAAVSLTTEQQLTMDVKMNY